MSFEMFLITLSIGFVVIAVGVTVVAAKYKCW